MITNIQNISCHLLKVKMSLLILNENEQDITKLVEPFASAKKNFFFYTVTLFKNELQWHQVIALRTGFSVNKIQFLTDMIIDDSHFDLRGLKIRSLDLDWEPYVRIVDCDNNKGCKVNGFNIDMVDLIAGQLNFTYESTKEPNGEWGYEMLDGTAASINANWSGVMGGVITGQYDMSLSSWLYQGSVHI